MSGRGAPARGGSRVHDRGDRRRRSRRRPDGRAPAASARRGSASRGARSRPSSRRSCEPSSPRSRTAPADAEARRVGPSGPPRAGGSGCGTRAPAAEPRATPDDRRPMARARPRRQRVGGVPERRTATRRATRPRRRPPRPTTEARGAGSRRRRTARRRRAARTPQGAGRGRAGSDQRAPRPTPETRRPTRGPEAPHDPQARLRPA